MYLIRVSTAMPNWVGDGTCERHGLDEGYDASRFMHSLLTTETPVAAPALYSTWVKNDAFAIATKGNQCINLATHTREEL